MNQARCSHGLVPLALAIIATLITLVLTMTYVNGALQGRFQHLFLPSQVFGIPEQLAAHGYEPLFQDGHSVGWDGQFYFSIANDPLARRDTPRHIDYDAYRYQRIGLPLLAFVAARLTGQNWVSPQTYYLTSLFILFTATWMGAWFLGKRGVHPAWMLIWTLGMGTQVTQLHGLPDAAADGLLIMALVCLQNRHRLSYNVLASLAALTRETYIIFPVAILVAGFLLDALDQGWQSRLRLSSLLSHLRRGWHNLLPIWVFLAWQAFVRHRFQMSPSAQASIIEILDWPFKQIFRFLLAPLTGLRPPDRPSLMESAGVLIFLAVLLTAAWILNGFIRRTLRQRISPSSVVATNLGIGMAFALITGMYFCFGRIVMMDNTGYWKAASIFLLMYPLLAAIEGRSIPPWPRILALGSFILFGVSLFARVTTPAFVNVVKIDYAQTEPACLRKFDAKIEPLSVDTSSGSWWQRLTEETPVLVTIAVTNSGNEDWQPYQGKGSVAASYQWVNAATGAVILDGLRTPLRGKLAPHQTVSLPLRVLTPQTRGQYILKLSLVQEGCAWFYNANPTSSFDINYTVR